MRPMKRLWPLDELVERFMLQVEDITLLANQGDSKLAIGEAQEAYDGVIGRFPL